MQSSLAAVASRIAERNNALRNELASLDLLKSQQSEAERSEAADELRSAEVRRGLLAAVRSRHGLELECLRLAEEARKSDASAAALRNKTEALATRTTELAKKFDEEHAPVYAKHGVATKLHAMKEGARLAAAEGRKREREDRLATLRERAGRQRGEAGGMRAEAARVREECEERDRREEEDDEETVALAMQIRSVLAKKASLRSALNEAKEVHSTASSNREAWERRCVEGK
ncbi:hypothetical protein ACHAXT_007902 [Thalassiosira profunda]